jgi:VWFA-related protein
MSANSIIQYRIMVSASNASALKRIKCLALLSLMLGGNALYSQDDRSFPEKLQNGQTTFKVPINIMIIKATVTDSSGNPVTDLTQNDFKIYDDGELQPTQTFALEFYQPFRKSKSALKRTGEQNASAAEAISAPSRMISIFIDDVTAESSEHYHRVIKAVERLIKEDIGPEDQIALFSGSGRVNVPFSNDKQMLLEELGTVFNQLNIKTVMKLDCPDITDLQAQMIVKHRQDDLFLSAAVTEAMACLSPPADDAESAQKIAEQFVRTAASSQYEESEYRSRTLLHTLRQYIRSLRHFEGRKNVVLISDGFLHEDVAYELQDIADQAMYSGVTVNTVDSRGLYTYLRPASERGPLVQGSFAGKQRIYSDSMLAQEAPLSQLASDTGGLFHHNSNDLYEGLRQIANRNAFHYVLTYAMPDVKPDGSYRRIKLEVSRPGLKLSYRNGYYAPREQLTFEHRKKEDILEALQAPGNLNEIPIGLGYNYYQENDAVYAVSFLASINIRGLHFFFENARHRNLINLVVAVFDEYDHFVQGLEKSIDFKLTEASYTRLLDNGFTARIEFQLPLGRYKIKAVVREGAQGKMGSITKGIEIP